MFLKYYVILLKPGGVIFDNRNGTFTTSYVVTVLFKRLSFVFLLESIEWSN